METLNNINGLIKNSSQTVWRGFSSIWKSNSNKCEDCLRNGKSGKALISSENAIKLSEIASRREVLLLLQSSNWIRIAGLFGATAVAMGAYGAHGLYHVYHHYLYYSITNLINYSHLTSIIYYLSFQSI